MLLSVTIKCMLAFVEAISISLLAGNVTANCVGLTTLGTAFQSFV